MKNLLLLAVLVSLPLLLGGCGNEPVVEVKPELDSVNAEELEERESIMYLKDSETPYTGNVYSVHPNGKKKVEGNYKDGEQEGLWVEWYLDGQKKSEENYKDGRYDGLQVIWHKNGQKKEEGNFKDRVREGLWVEWHENGQKSREVNYKDGDYNGQWLEFDENGQKAMEYNYKDGKVDGLMVWWHQNGQKSSEVKYKDNRRIQGSEKYWNSKGEPVNSREEAESEK